MTYDETVSQLKTMLTVEMNDEDINFTRIIPGMMLYADGRIYREVPFLAKKITQPTTLIALSREFTAPTNVRAIRSINVMTPLGPITTNSKRNPLERVSAEMLDFCWPQESFKPTIPQKYAVVGIETDVGPDLSYLVRLWPTPDRAYAAELLGDIRPQPLAPENPETFLSVFYPELLIAACMVYGTGYQRDFGAQSDDPTRAVSWEAQYTALRQGVLIEAGRMAGVHEEATPTPASA
jgi:hypothetical protein